MVKRLLALMVVGMLVFVACGDDAGTEPEGEEVAAEDRGECEEDTPSSADIPDLPANFPIPGEAVLTKSSQAGPTLIVEGYFEADIENAFPEYREAFESSEDYDVTKEEQEENDAEVFFAGEGTSGQVNMFAECNGRTKLRITIRPD